MYWHLSPLPITAVSPKLSLLNAALLQRGQLGHGDLIQRNVPSVIEALASQKIIAGGLSDAPVSVWLADSHTHSLTSGLLADSTLVLQQAHVLYVPSKHSLRETPFLTHCLLQVLEDGITQLLSHQTGLRMPLAATRRCEALFSMPDRVRVQRQHVTPHPHHLSRRT